VHKLLVGTVSDDGCCLDWTEASYAAGQSASDPAVPSTASLQPISMVTFCGSFAQGSVSVPSKLQRPTKAPRTAISGVRQLFCVYATMAMPIAHIIGNNFACITHPSVGYRCFASIRNSSRW
jgi:hypothetical protein